MGVAMNRTTISIVFALSFLLAACGNKGGLFLESDKAVADELKQLDQSLDELEGLEDESAAPLSNVTQTDADSVTDTVDDTSKSKEAEDAAKKAKKKADDAIPKTE